MKVILRYDVLLPLILICALISGCKKDNSNTQGSIVGTWKLTSLSGNATANGTGVTNAQNSDITSFLYNDTASALIVTCQNITGPPAPPPTQCNKWNLNETWTFTSAGNVALTESIGSDTGISVAPSTRAYNATYTTPNGGSTGSYINSLGLDSLYLNQVLMDNMYAGAGGYWNIDEITSTTLTISISSDFQSGNVNYSSNYMFAFTRQ